MLDLEYFRDLEAFGNVIHTEKISAKYYHAGRTITLQVTSKREYYTIVLSML